MNPRNSIAALILITVALTLLASCNRKTIYSHYEHPPLAGWEKNDTLLFHVYPIRSEGNYQEHVGLRINGDYPFTGLSLIVEQRTVPSGMMRSDTLHTRLIDHDGTIQGKGVSLFQYEFHLANLYLSSGDTLIVSIRHNMKREMLHGISDIGVTLSAF